MALKICQLNVNGMSDMTVMALENYIKDQEIDIMCLSETKAKELPSGSFPNMKSIIRPNKLNPRMRGVAIIANSNIPLTEYPEFEPPTADMCVCVLPSLVAYAIYFARYTLLQMMKLDFMRFSLPLKN